MYCVPVKVKKEALKDVCLDDGDPRLLASSYTVNGVTHAAGTLVFIGFRGVRVANGVWGGNFCFDVASGKKPEKSITDAVLARALADIKSTKAVNQKK